jgi:hypothetical protein
MRYEISEETIYEEEDRTSLSQLMGPARGITTEAWPRLHGRPMQHLFTLDLQGVELEQQAAPGARLLVVFAMALYELAPGAGDSISLRWVTQEELDRVPLSTPPDDYEVIGEIGESAYEELTPALGLTELDESDEANHYDAYVGGEPVWSDAGEPDDKPAGRFLLQGTSLLFPITRRDSQLYLFEGGAYIQLHEEPDEDESVAVPWPAAIAASRELVRHDSEPEPGALQKWGGLPRGLSEDDWPEGMSHLLTFEPARWPDDGPEDAIAIAVFANLEQLESGELEGVYELVPVLRDTADQVPEAPADVPVLPEKRLELRPFPAETTYFDLRMAAYEGPRLAWRRPSAYDGIEEGAMGFQLTEAWLPGVSTPGTVYFDTRCDCDASWQAAGKQEPAGAAEAIDQVDGLAGTLYEEETGTAIVVGHRLSIAEDSLLSIDELERFASVVKEANQIHGLHLELIVPGDTTTDRDIEASAILLLGQRVAQMDASDNPLAVDRLRVQRALAAFAPIPASYWKMLEDAAEAFESSKEPALFLATYGPLCTGALYIGRALDDEDEAIYSFTRCQDMEQDGSEGGVDGVELASVGFTDLEELSFSDKTLEEHNAAVSELEDPRYFLVCYYD